ncbi:TIGR02099 family protein [Lysobacter pythonis]|uniref:TIGR02099 family protein n=1 Tax=Solilutibacter pythonis TaxID=2483112 RepID=A0A3M2HUS1_9GAMM|nr:YhdP family protein [Lysobacter pythonis]RMH91159.1 TIGR02099 family protein [Lysobacter pythonis]
MPSPLRRGLRFAGKSVWYVFALVALSLALAFGAAIQSLNWLEANPARVAGWLSAKASQPVAFSGLEAEWTRRGPLLRLSGLRVGPGADAIPIGQAEVLLAPYTGWLPGRRMTELRLHGLALTLERNVAGEWHVRGMPGQSGRRDPLDSLQDLGELQVVGGRLRVLAPASGIDVEIPRIDLRVQVGGARVRAGVRAWPRAGQSPLTGSLDFNRESGDGRFFAGARRLDLAGWSELLRWRGLMLVAGHGRAQTWLALKGHRVASVSSVADLSDVVLAPADPAPGALPELRFERLRQRARFVREEAGWRFDLPQLALRRQGRETRMDGLAIARRQDRWAIDAPQVSLEPLLALVDLSDALPTGLRHWIGRARPSGEVRGLSMRGEAGRLDWVEADTEGLGFLPVGDAPGLSGVGGRVNGDGDGVALALDPRARMVFDWPRGFGVKHPISARGTVALWREGKGVRLGTGHLRVEGEGYRGDARGGLWFQNDGSRPWIDLAANIDGAEVPVAKKFWIRHLMPKEAVQWLDMALVGGRLRHARAIVSGDLDDWPFSRHNGRFEALAQIENGQLRFQPDWPPIQSASLKAAFIGPGMKVEGGGQLGGVQIEAISAEIPNFDRAELSIEARGRGDAAGFLAVLRGSPLDKTLADTFARVAASGPARATFSLFQPLHGGGPPQRIAGTVDLQGASLSERELKLTFRDVRGRARYDGHGFRADALAVTQEGRPGRLSLRAGTPHVEDRRNVFEADLAGSLTAAALLDRAPDMAWLKPWLHGRSAWNVAVALPAGGAAANALPSRVTLSSNLVGTAIDLPPPLGKPAGEPLAATVRIPMPVDNGEVDVSLGQRLGLRARHRGGRTGIRATLGRANAAGAPPAQGLVVDGRAGEVDALAWAGFVGGLGGGVSGNALGPVRIDVRAARLLLLLGQRFAETRMQVETAGNATRARLEGVGIAGSLAIPHAEGATVNGRFQRVDFAIGTPLATANGVVQTAAGGDIDPAGVPPLDIAVQDFRLNGSAFGQLAFRSRPSTAGMQVEALELRAPRQRIDVSGSWNGRGVAARSRFDAQLRSEDFGGLLGAFGLSGQMRKGQGNAALSLAWPGAPSDFDPARIEGSLAALIKDGQLSELEPGAGRVLGLLSVARLPHRLTLDFRDFFDKGFAFDRIEGRVRFGEGHARSEGIVIEGPAAQIGIAGSADLRAQRFDQTIEVKPRTGNLLTVAGALAGGPVGAAVGAVANAVLKKPLSEVGAKTYRVTGPWGEPKVEVLAKPRAQHAASPPP